MVMNLTTSAGAYPHDIFIALEPVVCCTDLLQLGCLVWHSTSRWGWFRSRNCSDSNMTLLGGERVMQAAYSICGHTRFL